MGNAQLKSMSHITRRHATPVATTGREDRTSDRRTTAHALAVDQQFPDDLPQLFTTYRLGDYVVPTDLPRRFLCRVTYAQAVEGTPLQVLELAPLDGPWPRATRLVRGSDWVRPAVASELERIRRRGAHSERPPRRRSIERDQPGPIRLLPKSTHSSNSTPTGTPIR
jgi:hypothetical protein